MREGDDDRDDDRLKVGREHAAVTYQSASALDVALVEVLTLCRKFSQVLLETVLRRVALLHNAIRLEDTRCKVVSNWLALWATCDRFVGWFARWRSGNKGTDSQIRPC